jgi:hypothetical protein
MNQFTLWGVTSRAGREQANSLLVELLPERKAKQKQPRNKRNGNLCLYTFPTDSVFM